MTGPEVEGLMGPLGVMTFAGYQLPVTHATFGRAEGEGLRGKPGWDFDRRAARGAARRV